ncbi:PREDICTED: universal stress protein PHOS32-like [Nelumbo nucifera]|uniref:Universal stress protein PHOS32-like n=2 Tax=Nelumbo nucifera TaxID=4432 RepID=A0A1U8AC90_NELNU|nr:PREDICTED: universal stress protein PHOS32-like [Nelumbo nucifera]DAD38234.1 TPA_asm: hypothetical protein HUJ06_008875 [Nelumbo nucifera]
MADFEAKERRVMVAVDESEESMYALSWCLKNLIPPDAQTTLILLYAKPPPPVYSSLDGTGYLFASDVIATMEKYSRDLADSVMERAEAIFKNHSNIKVEKKVGSGDAREVICMTVEKFGADLLVMGSHGYGFFKRTVLGSVSDYCAKHAKCPVLIVKRPKN